MGRQGSLTMAAFQLRHWSPSGPVLITGEALVGQEYIALLTPDGSQVSSTTWDDLAGLHAPPDTWLVWPDGLPE